MNLVRLRTMAPIVYGVVAAVLWIFGPRSVALVLSVVGALALGLMYVFTGTQLESRGLGRQRDRNRNRRRSG